MVHRRLSNIIGFDDAPFVRGSHEPVPLVGAVFAGVRFDGVLIGSVSRDGFDAATRIVELVRGSKFAGHVRLILLQGITVAGFNVIDPFFVYKELELPVLVVSRRRPDLQAFRCALLANIDQGVEKWEIIERLGPMEPVKGLYIQRVGLTLREAEEAMDRTTVFSRIPEPIRTAHLIAGALTRGESRGAP